MRTRASSLANSEAKGTWGSVRRFPSAFVIRNIMVEMGFKPLQMVSVAALAVLPGILAHVIEEIEDGKPLRIVRDEDQDYIGLSDREIP
jgi:citrate synthase